MKILSRTINLVVIMGVLLLLKMQYITNASIDDIIQSGAINRDSIERLIKDDVEEIVAAIERETKEMHQLNLFVDSLKVNNNRQTSVSFDKDNVLYPTNATAEEIFVTLEHFSGGSLAEYAWTFKQVENDYGINAFFMAALVAYESAWGNSYRANTQNNLTGYAVFNSQAAGATFNSRDGSIISTAELLANNYLNSNGRNYHGVSVEAINTDYCLTEDSSRTDYNWSKNIISIANDFVEYYHSDVKELQEIPEK